MADFEETTVQKKVLPRLDLRLELAAGAKIADNADIVAFAQKVVPAGKAALVEVHLVVRQLIDV